MSRVQKLYEVARSHNWLSAGALWAVIGAWAACGVWGWSQSTTGLMTVITVALTIGCQVFAARAVKNAAAADDLARKALLVLLGAASLAFTGWSGKQGLAVSEAARWAPYEARQGAHQAVDAIDRKIDALPLVPLSDAAGRPIGPVRTKELGAQRSNEVTRLSALRSEAQAKLDTLPAVATPTPKMPEGLAWALVALIEGLELLGFYAIGRTKPADLGGADKPASAVDINHARELAKRRWSQA